MLLSAQKLERGQGCSGLHCHSKCVEALCASARTDAAIMLQLFIVIGAGPNSSRTLRVAAPMTWNLKLQISTCTSSCIHLGASSLVTVTRLEGGQGRQYLTTLRKPCRPESQASSHQVQSFRRGASGCGSRRLHIHVRCKQANCSMLGLKGGGLKGLLEKKRKAAEEEFGNSATAKRAQIESVRQQHLRQEEQAELDRQVRTQPSPVCRPGCQVLWQIANEQRLAG